MKFKSLTENNFKSLASDAKVSKFQDKNIIIIKVSEMYHAKPYTKGTKWWGLEYENLLI